MKNYEKYIDEVLIAASEGGGISVDNLGDIRDCGDIPCACCIFDGIQPCNEKALEWLKAEYVESEIVLN